MNNYPFAFPSQESDGMSLRDYFAAHAMQALISTQQPEDINDEILALSAWQIADEMLLHRG